MADYSGEYGKLFEYLSAPEAPTDAQPAIVFGRQDPLVAHAAGELATAGLADILVITGGIGKDSGNLVEEGFDSEAGYLGQVLAEYAAEHGVELPPVILEKNATNGGENARLSLDEIAWYLTWHGLATNSLRAVTTVTHATSLRRLAAGTAFQAWDHMGIRPTIHRVPTAYDFDPTKPVDQKEAVAEMMRLVEWPGKGLLLPQTDLPPDLVEFALDMSGKSPNKIYLGGNGIPKSPTAAETDTLTAEQLHEKLVEANVVAALVAMKIVHGFQMGKARIEALDDKANLTLLSRVDLASEKAILEVLLMLFPNIPVLGEEFGMSSGAINKYLRMVDSIDGTRPFMAGASTSSIILALFNYEIRRFTSTTVVEPATGRMWHTDSTRTMRSKFNPETGDQEMEAVECHVWDGSIKDNATVLIDNFAAFKRDDRQIMDTDNVRRLFADLQSEVAVQNYGSNGIHQALVANGGDKLAGSITTAMGGEYDVAGALLVINAGGVAQGIRVNDDRTLTLADPLDPFGYDMLVTANNQASLDYLVQKVTAAFAPTSKPVPTRRWLKMPRFLARSRT